VIGQQIKINSGAYLNNTGATIVVNGKVDNAGAITNSGTIGFNVSGNWLNSGTFIAGAAIHKIGGNFTNNGTFAETGSTITCNGTSSQSIDGTNSTTFDNLTIDNAIGVMLNSNALTIVSGALTINSGKIFKLASGRQLEVNGTITNSAGTSGFVLQSDATGTASLIHNTNSVPATVQRYISGAAEDWHFLSSPVSNQSIGGSWLPSGTYGNGTGYDLYLWNEPNSCWIYKLNTTTAINWNTVHPGANFETGRGYLYSVQATNPTKEFIGNLNNGPINYGLTISSTDLILKGFNLVGNPYPSSIDWSSSSGWTRTNLTSSGGGYNMWIWNPAVSNYGVYNSADGDGIGTNSVTKNIAPMQGFFVQSASAGNISTNNSVRVFEGASNWFKSKGVNGFVSNKLSISVKSDEGHGADEVQLRFGYNENENGAMKLFSKVLSAPSLYLPSDGKYLSVHYFTTPKENLSVPLMFTPGVNGKYEINCNFDFGAFDTIMLEDSKMHYIQDMKLENSYSFSASKSDNPNRFLLHFGNIKNITTNEFNAKVYTNEDRVVIDLSLVNNETIVFIYDILGRILFQQILHGENKHFINLSAHNQIVIVSLKNPNGSLTQKLFWEGK